MIVMIAAAFLGQAVPADRAATVEQALAAMRAAPIDQIKQARQSGAVVRDRQGRPDVRIVRVENDLVLIAFGAAETWMPASAFTVTDLGLQVPLSIEDLEAEQRLLEQQSAEAAAASTPK